MKYNFLFLGIILNLLITTSLNGQNQSIPKNEVSSNFTYDQKVIINSTISELPKNTQFSIAIIEDEKTNYLGVKNKNDEIETVDNQDSVFEIGSITKVMTSALLTNAIVKGDVTLDTEISELIGYPLLNDNKISLAQLSNHTAGLMRMPGNFLFAQMKDPDNPYIHYDEEQLKTWLTEYMTPDLKHDKSNYSNLGAALLAYGLTKKYNKDYESLLQEIIFQKLGMTSSTTKLDNVKSKLVKGQNPNGEVTSNWEFDVLAGAGAVLSTVSDLALFAKAVMDQKDEALNLQTKPTFDISDNMSIALGWHIIHSKSGHDYLWHNGGTSGYTSSFLIDVERGISIIILSNVSAFHPQMGSIDNMIFQLANTFD